MAKKDNWTPEELEAIDGIVEGLRLNGWHLLQIRKEGKAWNFTIIELEEYNEK